jgi:hypothetical protein
MRRSLAASSSVVRGTSDRVRGLPLLSGGTLFMKLISFIPPADSNRQNPLAFDSRFAGHFQQIFCSFLRASGSWSESLDVQTFEKMLQFARENIDCLAYQQLLTTIAADFEQMYMAVNPSGLPHYFESLLVEAARQVRIIQRFFIELRKQRWEDKAFLLMNMRCSLECNGIETKCCYFTKNWRATKCFQCDETT